MTLQAGEFERLDCLLTWGRQRPDWRRTGDPSIHEWALLLWMRGKIFEGYPAMCIASLHIQARLAGEASKKPPAARREEPVVFTRRLQERPVGMADDDPLIGKVYR